MARVKKKKTGVMEGYPKLAFYTGSDKNIRIPPYSSAWICYDWQLKSNDLVVLVASGINYDYRQYYNFRYVEIPMYHIIPVSALEAGRTPMTCIYNWKRNYVALPKFEQKLFTVIEKDSGERAIAAAVAA